MRDSILHSSNSKTTMDHKIPRITYIKPKLFVLCMISIICIAVLIITVINGRVSTTFFLILDLICILTLSATLFSLFFMLAIPAINIEKWIRNNKDNKNYNKLIQSNTDLANLFNLLASHLKETTEREYAATLLQKQAEFNVLQSQINPHFLYNTLESIRCEALMIDAYEVADMTEALSLFFRYGIGKSNELVTLDDEIENIKVYFKIQQFRFENRFSLKITYEDPSEKLFTFYLPRLTLQPIIENSIHHGLEKKVGSGEIAVHISTTPNLLIINIKDNGIGIKESVLQNIRKHLNSPHSSIKNISDQNGTGIALTNVDQRIQLLFGDQYGLTISSTVNVGTSVEILLPHITDLQKTFY